MQKEIGLPLGIIVKPFGNRTSGVPLPNVKFGQNTIVRCKECRAYVNPFIRFVESG